MGILFCCPNCDHPLNIKANLAGRAGVCPRCSKRLVVPDKSQLEPVEFDALVQQRGKNGRQSAPRASEIISKAKPAGIQQEQTLARATQASASDAPLIKGNLSAPSSAAADAPRPLDEPTQRPTEPQSAGDQPVFDLDIDNKRENVAADPAFTATLPGQSTPPGALREAPDSQWYVRPPTGGQFGPANVKIMEKWIGEGRVTGDSYVWRDGWVDWRLAGEVFSELIGYSSPVDPRLKEIDVPGSVRARVAYLKARRRRTILGVVGLIAGSLIVLALIAILFVVIKQQNERASDDESSIQFNQVKEIQNA